MDEFKQNNYLLPFQVGPFPFCAPVNEVEAIIEIPKMSSVPLTQNSMEGVFDYRGKVAKVINLKRKFGLEQSAQPQNDLIILAKLESGLTGFRIDEVTEIIPSLNLQKFKLSSESSITAFDSFIINNDKIILNTSFNQLFKVEDSTSKRIHSQKTVKTDTFTTETENEKVPDKLDENAEIFSESQIDILTTNFHLPIINSLNPQ